jgi:hypothetical protein
MERNNRNCRVRRTKLKGRNYYLTDAEICHIQSALYYKNDALSKKIVGKMTDHTCGG